MGVPKIDITFKELTSTAVARSSRGAVALLLEDTTVNEPAVFLREKEDIDPAKWTEKSAAAIAMTMDSGASRVLAVRVQEDGYAAALASIAITRWNWLAAPDASAENTAEIIGWIGDMRAAGKTYKAVVANADAPNSEGIVNFAAEELVTNFGGAARSMDAAAYTPRMAGILAGIPLNRSVTGMELNDIVSAAARAKPDDDVDEGRLILIYNGEKYEIARGVTSLTEKEGVPSLFRKIKHVEGADLIAEDIKDIFKGLYKGRKVNNYTNKQALVGDLTGYLAGITGSVVSDDYNNVIMVDAEAQKAYLRAHGKDTSGMTEVEILKAGTGEEVFLKANIMLLDAMEDLTMEIELA